MKNLTGYHKVAIGAVAIVAIYFAYKHFTKPEVIVIEEVAEVAE